MLRNFRTPSHHAARVALMLTGLIAFTSPAEGARKTSAPPIISGTPPTVTTVDTAYWFRPEASDPDGNRISFRISGKPSWATFSSSTGQLSGTPTAIGTYGDISIRVTDGRTAVALPTFSISVKANTAVAVNTPPIIGGTAPPSIVAGSSYFFQPTGYDADGDTLTYSIVNKPTWATFNQSSGSLSGTPADADSGTYGSITISASDGESTSTLEPFGITVTAPVTNRAPTISGMPKTSALADSAYTFSPTASDADGDPLTFSIQGKPSWAAFSAATGALSGTPLTANVGTYSNIVISVSDGKVMSALPAFSIAVTAATNRAPSLTGTPVTSAVVDRPYSFSPTASDADGDPLTFSIQGKPAWATFDTATGTLYGTPVATNVGTYSNIVISVSDGRLTTAMAPFAITVESAATKTVTLTWTPPTLNTDGSPLTDLAGYTVLYGTASRQYSTSIKLSGATTTSVVLEGFELGTWYFSVKASNAAGVESDFATEAVAVL